MSWIHDLRDVSPLALTVSVGLVVATALTLFVAPAVYSPVAGRKPQICAPSYSKIYVSCTVWQRHNAGALQPGIHLAPQFKF